MFLQVDEYMPLDPEHPCHGSLPYLKLVTQPPTQLPVAAASLASFAETDPVAGGACVVCVCAVRRDAVLRATGRCLGTVARFGASTVTLGSEAAEPGGICDSAEPLRLHSSSIDTIARAGLATKSDENLIVTSSRNRDGQAVPMRTIAQFNWLDARHRRDRACLHEKAAKPDGRRGVIYLTDVAAIAITAIHPTMSNATIAPRVIRAFSLNVERLFIFASIPIDEED